MSNKDWHSIDEPPEHEYMVVLLDLPTSKLYECGLALSLGWYSQTTKEWVLRTGHNGRWTHWTDIPDTQGM